MRTLIVCLVLLLASPAAMAQAIPDHIPDRPDHSPGDVNRERLVERHRAELSRLFAASHMAVSPLGQASFSTDRLLQGGVNLPGGDAIHVTMGARVTHFDMLRTGRPGIDQGETAFLVAFGYDLPAVRVFGSGDFARRTVLGFGIGTMTGDVPMLTAEVNPRVTLFTARRFSVPVGLRVTTTVFSDGASSAVSQTFVGASAGFRMNLMSRDRMEMR